MYNPSRSYEAVSPYSYQPKIQHPVQNQTSVALFHIPSDAKNSIYVDGIPNDATEREVSRKHFINFQISSVHIQVSNRSVWFESRLRQGESICFVLWISKTISNRLSQWTLLKDTDLTSTIRSDWRFHTRMNHETIKITNEWMNFIDWLFYFLSMNYKILWIMHTKKHCWIIHANKQCWIIHTNHFESENMNHNDCLFSRTLHTII